MGETEDFGRDWDVMVLMETWVKEKGWRRIRRNLPEGFVWGREVYKKEC